MSYLSRLVIILYSTLFCVICLYTIDCRVTTCLENLEMSGNLTAVREMSGKNLVRKSYLKLFIVNYIHASTHLFSTSMSMV